MSDNNNNISEIISQVKLLAENKIKPLVTEADRAATCPSVIPGFFQSMDLYKFVIPEKYGGLGLPFTDFLSVIEEISRICAGIASVLSVPAAGILPIFHYMDPSEIKNLNEAYFSGDRLFGYALSGADGIYGDPAKRLKYSKADGGFSIYGTVSGVLLGALADAVVLIAFEDPGDISAKGTAFLLETDISGVSVKDPEEAIGLRAIPRQSLTIKDAFIPDNRIIGEIGGAEKIVEKCEAASRLIAASQAIGILRSAYDHARKYSMERVQFGHKIGKFQAIEHMLIDMRISENAGRGLLNIAAGSFSVADKSAPSECAQAKLFCTDAAMKASTDSVQIHGGFGYMRDFPVEKLMRDAKMLQVLYGMPHHLKSLIAEQM